MDKKIKRLKEIKAEKEALTKQLAELEREASKLESNLKKDLEDAGIELREKIIINSPNWSVTIPYIVPQVCPRIVDVPSLWKYTPALGGTTTSITSVWC